MSEWKKIAIRAAGFGGGFGLIVILAVGVFLWRSNRPQKPKPWDSKAVTATFDIVETEGEKNTLVFVYTLENNTDIDYRVTGGSDIHLAATLKDQRSFSFDSDGLLKVDYPIYIPARGRVRFSLHVAYPYPTKEDLNASDDVRHDYRTQLAQFTAKEFSNLAGFAMLDDNSRYQVNMPNGWIERAKEPLRVKPAHIGQ